MPISVQFCIQSNLALRPIQHSVLFGIQSHSAFKNSKFSLILHSKFRDSGIRPSVQFDIQEFGIQSHSWFGLRRSGFRIQEFDNLSFGIESVNSENYCTVHEN